MVPRAVWPALAWATVAFAATPSGSLGGLVVEGAGLGDASGLEGFGGPYVCEDVPFEVTAVYLPGGTGLARYSWASVAASGENCFVVSNGGTNSVGTVSSDLATIPARVTYEAPCTGSEAQGLACGGFLFIGPYAGPGGSMWLQDTMPEHAFAGLFVAT